MGPNQFCPIKKSIPRRLSGGECIAKLALNTRKRKVPIFGSGDGEPCPLHKGGT